MTFWALPNFLPNLLPNLVPKSSPTGVSAISISHCLGKPRFNWHNYVAQSLAQSSAQEMSFPHMYKLPPPCEERNHSFIHSFLPASFLHASQFQFKHKDSGCVSLTSGVLSRLMQPFRFACRLATGKQSAENSQPEQKTEREGCRFV